MIAEESNSAELYGQVWPWGGPGEKIHGTVCGGLPQGRYLLRGGTRAWARKPSR